ncbi:AMP-dependent synthetase [Cryobacterium glaciale]|uniref:acetate--CoA ligase n=1 Tax=Cryobacterium glaciale TaxID=1259145 RepID=A0A4R8V5Y2_9MICO|nr:AMP-binding protein [Cryobacterium glaciale]TFB77305.1 AMP-dependent synthetase [Cryobacterium glaciale]
MEGSNTTMSQLPEWFEVDRWVPPPASIEQRRVSKFMQKLGLDDYQDFLRYAIDKPEEFYRAAMADLDLEWQTEWHTLVDQSDGAAWSKWFVGGTTNLAWLALDRWVERGQGDRLALEWEGEDGSTRSYTYAQLADEVSRVAAGLRAHGVVDGDVVGLYLPPLPEAVISMFAIARIGAVVAPAFSGYGEDALSERLEIVGAKHLVTANRYLHHGHEVEMISVARTAATKAGIENVFVVPRLGKDDDCQSNETPWRKLLDHEPEQFFTWFGPEKPWLIAFTSGSSGRPKGAVHCHGRMPYRAAIDMAYCIDMSDDSCLYWPSDMGWIIAPLGLITSFTLGGRHLIYEGAPTFPAPDTLWKLVDRYKVTHLGSSPTLMRLLAAHGAEWVEPYGLESLQVIVSAGEPMTSAAWRWMHRNVGRGIRPLMNHTGGTEIGCALLTGSPVLPMRECRFAGPPPGLAVVVVNSEGHPVVDELGELAVLAPWPSMTYGFWNENERWTVAHASKFEGVYIHGDRAIQHSDGSWEVPGRSDDLLKVGGKRIGPSEYEELALGIRGVSGAAAVGIPDELKGQTVMIIITLAPEYAHAGESISDSIHERVEHALGKPFRISRVAIVDELPLTRNSKIHRRALRAWLLDLDPGDLSNLENPSAAEAIRSLAAPAVPHPAAAH